jgi:hypothetical protein
MSQARAGRAMGAEIPDGSRVERRAAAAAAGGTHDHPCEAGSQGG